MPSKAERFAAQDRDSGVSAASEVMAKRYSSSARPQQLAPGEILFDPGNPREDGWQNNVKDLSASMLSVGVLEPISIVHRDVWLTEYPGREADIGDADWVVAYGNRRLAAAVVAELSTVPVQVKDNLAEQQRSQEARLIENVQRADLPPLVEAYEVVSLVKKHGTNRAVAKILGMSEGWVTQRKQLVNLTPELQTELTQQSITVEDARQLGKIPQLRQMEAYHAGKPYTDPADQPKTAPRQLPPGAPAVVDDHSPAADTEATQADSATASSDSNTGVVPRGRLSESAGRATQQAAPQQEAAPDPVTDAVSDPFYAVEPHGSDGAAADADEHPTVTGDTPAARGSAAPGVAFSNNSDAVQAPTVPVPLAPAPLAQLLLQRFTAQQRDELVRLLADDADTS